VADDEFSVRRAVKVGFNTVIGAIARSNERRVRILSFDARKASVRHHKRTLFIKFDRIHSIPLSMIKNSFYTLLLNAL
jgi:hypothetical protein